MAGRGGADSILVRAGDDRIQAALFDVTGNEAIDGGTGTDPLLANAASLAATSTLLGVERIEVAGGSILPSGHHLAGVNAVLAAPGSNPQVMTANVAGPYDLSAITLSRMTRFQTLVAAMTVVGSAGADNILGAGDSDSMVGGLGADLYRVYDVADIVTEEASAWNDAVEAGISYTLGANIEDLVLLGRNLATVPARHG